MQYHTHKQGLYSVCILGVIGIFLLTHRYPRNQYHRSGSVQVLFDEGTSLTIVSVQSGIIQNLTGLEQAKILLTDALARGTGINISVEPIMHNLAMIDRLLGTSETQQDPSSTQQQEQHNGGTEEQSGNEENTPSDEQQPTAQGDNTEGGDTQVQEANGEEEGDGAETDQQPALSEEQRAQLEQYQQQLAEEQLMNQQFFDKQDQSSPDALGDPFSMFEQFFGVNPRQLDQSLPDQQEQDW